MIGRNTTWFDMYEGDWDESYVEFQEIEEVWHWKDPHRHKDNSEVMSIEYRGPERPSDHDMYKLAWRKGLKLRKVITHTIPICDSMAKDGDDWVRTCMYRIRRARKNEVI